MPLIKALIVDDEAVARRHLRTLLQEYPEIEVVGESSSVPRALDLYRELQPELLFVDVDIGAYTGFDLVNQINETNGDPYVIFLTAHPRFAVRAFEVRASDYLVKPLFRDRLKVAIERLHSSRSPVPEKHPAPVEPHPPAKASGIFLPSDTGRIFIQADQIALIEADGNYTRVFLDDGKNAYVYRSLTEWSKILPAHPFVHVSRSIILNADHMVTSDRMGKTSLLLRLKGVAKTLTLGRAAIQRLRPILKRVP